MKWAFSKANDPLLVDIHSHLIPGIDDGSSTMAESLEMIVAFRNQGYKKLITTPHIHPRYPNTHDEIAFGLEQLQRSLASERIEMEVEAAAEYFVDETFIDRLKRNDSFLTFGDRYILIECSFITKPIFFKTTLFNLQELGYRPVFAHPERYQFLEGKIDWLLELKESGLLFQVTLGSLSGYYGSFPQKIGMKLLKMGMVDFLASDLHRMTQFKYLKKAVELKEVQRSIRSGQLLNHSLL